MTNDQIKLECDLCREEIKKATERLEEIQNICPHEETFQGIWSYRIGSYNPAIICSNCGKLVKLLLP